MFIIINQMEKLFLKFFNLFLLFFLSNDVLTFFFFLNLVCIFSILRVFPRLALNVNKVKLFFLDFILYFLILLLDFWHSFMKTKHL